MDENILKLIKSMQESINDLTQRMDAFTNGRIDDTNDTQNKSLGITEHNEKDKKFIAEQIARLNQITLGSIELTEEQMLEVPDLYPLWESMTSYEVGKIVKWGWSEEKGISRLWKCVQAHVSQDDWKPDVVASLWSEIGFTPSGIEEWRRPAGAHNTYKQGDIVNHNGKNWISIVDNNSWEPGVYGWEEYKG